MSEARRARALLLALCAAGVLGVVLTAALERRDLAFTTGVPITRVAAILKENGDACQGNVHVLEDFDRVELVPVALDDSTPPLGLEVLDARAHSRVAGGRADGGYPDKRRLAIATGRVPAGTRIDVCVRNRGDDSVGIAGGKAESVAGSTLVANSLLDERRALTLRFRRAEPRSVLSQVPVVFERAALFRPGWVGPWTFWALAALVALGVPLLLARALSAALAPDAGPRAPTERP
jgi:hypothetical protein